MNTNRATRIAVTSGAAVLCVGVVTPVAAYACDGTNSAAKAQTASYQVAAPTLQQEQSWIDSFVTHRTGWLDHLSAVVSADPNLSADQQAKALDSIAKARTALAELKSAVDAATSTAQVHDIVKAALEAMPAPWWPHPMARHALDRHAFEHHARKALHRDREAGKASPADVRLRSGNTRTVRFAEHHTQWRNRDGHRDFGGQRWSRQGDRNSWWGGGHHAFRSDHHDSGGWGR